ncbi:general secretion pathway protein GspK [Pseudomonas sp. GD03842]|uniref:general secretion pathway protein GspK n=1 Tax=unclassified Pseudomonas TaxID=196821 RepID=UPI000D34A880|nr:MULTISPECIES: general secretion pathway protein GspK [unclassified Pseudomonas]MDH0746875.1 general secretion pathway protein GspK [Pseudomonas sp. GD03842]RAU43878.1 general secretion pathway protein GspK [Pseudomonas sp. RIT 409]RAU56228.1 general secretion pathway protein GspK [Pseudomonas sp. RIT 412]
MTRQRGVALLLVLWVLALLSTLLAGLLGWVHLQNRQALWQRQHTQAVLAAEAGLAMAVTAQLDRDPHRHWLADGQPHALRFDDATLAVSLVSEAGKLDVNAAPVESFMRLVLACGGSNAQAQAVSGALNQRRGADRQPLRTVEEVRELPAMDQRVYQCASAHLTLWSGLPAPDAALASGWLRRVLNLPQASSAAQDAGPVVTVQSQATLPGGFNATLIVTLLLNPSKEGARPYRVLRWQE